jgi:hypothetical protein
MTVGDRQALTSSDFNGWPHLWVGPPSAPPPPRPEVSEFYASSYTVAPGEMVTLSWSTFGADRIALDGGEVAPEGMVQLMPSASGSHTLQASSSVVAASDARSLAITVNETPQPVAVETFVAEPARLERGRSATLKWQVRNATTLELDGKRAAPMESREVSPLETTTYVLTARGHQGPVEAKVTLVVEAQKTGLLPDRGGFTCGVGGPAAGAPPGRGAACVLLATMLVLARRRGPKATPRRGTPPVC